MKKIIYNLFFGLGGQLIILLLGFIIPRLLIVSYGSEVNGLITTAVQIFTYVTLLEAGIGNATVNALYRPLVSKDKLLVSDILSATKKFYKKASIWYLVIVIIVSLTYPFFANTDIDKYTVGLVIFFQGMSGLVTFYAVAMYKQLLLADGKNYITSNITLIISIITSIIKILLIKNGADIVLIQVSTFIISFFNAYLFIIYARKKYQWIKFSQVANMKLLVQRKAFMVHEISSVIFYSTDIFIISTFLNLKIASVYAIYSLVFTALNTIINMVNNGWSYLLGQSYQKGLKVYTVLHDLYEISYIAMVFSLNTVAYLMIIPFVIMYTEGVNDVNYVDPYLPILFCVIQVLSSCRAVSAKLISIAGHAQKTQLRSIIEAIINLTLSLVLVNFIGIYGVLLGTIVALLYRMNDIIFYANIVILNRKPFKTYFNIFINCLIFSSVIFIEYKFPVSITTYTDFIIKGFVYTVCSFALFFLINIFTNFKSYYLIFKKIVKQ